MCTTKPLPKWSKHHSRGWWTRARGEDWGPWGCARQSTELHPSAVVGFSQVNSSHRASNRRERPKANSASALAAHAARNMDWQSTTLRGQRLSLCTVQSSCICSRCTCRPIQLSLCRPDNSGRRFEPSPAWCSTPILFRGQSKAVLHGSSSKGLSNSVHRRMLPVLHLHPILRPAALIGPVASFRRPVDFLGRERANDER